MKKQGLIIGLILVMLLSLLPVSASAASLTVSPKTVSLQVGQSKTVKAKASGVTKPVYVWSTSNAKIATVKNGKITAKAVGKATITVSVQKTKLKSTVSVTVKPKVLDAQAAFKAVNPSVAIVEMLDANGQVTSFGSGYVSAKGEVVTNYHVVSGEMNHRARVRFADGTLYETFKLKRFDPDIDLAVLDIPLLTSIRPLPVATAGSTGSVVYALGSPRGVSNTITQGILSNRQVYEGGHPYLQFNASVTHGNSGGPLIDVYGQVIGVVTWGRIDSQNMNYAVPVSQLKSLKYTNETIVNVQQPSLPVVSGEGDTQEQELNDEFDDADVIQYARGYIEGMTYDRDDIDTFVFRVDRRTTLYMVGTYAKNAIGQYWAFGLFDANGETIRYSEDVIDKGLHYQEIELTIPPGEYYVATFSLSGLALNDYRQQAYTMYYELN
ncbi:trypsin-like peptidase domain-containing protein [Exiguobacterium sp. TNDT2]|uniref:trypsin-like peptidase domain-containing protein n=1 Tax=Exiguobacterium sp. TNDT2 TaxID=2233531 RepID=UPI000DEF10A0|nr:trypsin-like peptidase domain-containing protein [Exiguobacterium sp. TNDT2]